MLDADGLNLLAENPKWKNYLGRHVILTPHMGEMSRLTGKSIRELKSDRAGAARALAAETGVVCVLKDACTALGVLLHGAGGDQAAMRKGMAGMKAGDIARGVAEILKEQQNFGETKF